MSCDQCKDCAFKRRSLANLEVENHLKGILTVCAGTPFYCHEHLDWKRETNETQVPKASPAEMRARLLEITLPGATPHVCAGWKQAVGDLAAAGWFRGKLGRTRRLVAALALQSIRDLLASGNVGKRNRRKNKQLHMRIKNCLQVLSEDLKLMKIDRSRFGL